MIINMLILHYDAKASPTITILLGTVSVFMPNGYLLYNFAATFLVDFTFDGTKKFLFFHMLSVTAEFIICLSIIWAGQVNEWNFVIENIPPKSVLNEREVKFSLNVALILLGVLSLVLALIHWFKSIVPLYDEDTSTNNAQSEDVELKEQEIEQ